MLAARIYIVRHGETNENVAGIIQGQLDTKLNSNGVHQARLVASALRDVPFTAALTSDLERAVKTAEEIISHHPTVTLIKQAAVRERHMGELQGVQIVKGRTRAHRAKLPPSVESAEAFTTRVLDWWRHTILMGELAHLPDGRTAHILVVSHGAWIATLIRGLAFEKQIEVDTSIGFGTCFNTSVTTVELEGNGRGRLLRYSDIQHLLLPAVGTNADDQYRDSEQ